MKLAIVSVIYHEPLWQETKRLVDRCTGCTKVFIDRYGYGSLADAYNRGFERLGSDIDYVWFVSNPTWQHGALEKLGTCMKDSGLAAIHPAFKSDHLHLRPNGSDNIQTVPYIEFTAPMVRADVFRKVMLDEDMPYWGHDLDWSYRVRQLGYEVGVHHGIQLQHTYIRHSKLLPITEKRYNLRKQTNAATTQALINKYGPNWQDVLGYKP